MSQEGFTDLRLNSDGVGQEGFWPSFTDIMTVVVMIFLIAMVVLLVRNMELVLQLRATVEAERVAAELARATGAEKDSLSNQLHRAEERAQRMQLEILRLQDGKQRNESLIAEQLRAITGLTDERDDLARQAAELTRLREGLEADVALRQAKLDEALAEIDRKQLDLLAAQRSVGTLEDGLDRLRERLADSRQRSEALAQTIAAQRDELAAARLSGAEIERRYALLAEDFDALQVKYDDLVKPARSPAGRRLVEVRYWKQDGDYRIAWREGGAGTFQPIRRERLDKVLTRLSGEAGNGLYVKVIIPEDSGLTYNEAWAFTSHLHGSYDYYFKQDGQRPVSR
jgi:hypothetical protein